MDIANHAARINQWKHCKEGARNVREAIQASVGKAFESCAEVLPKRGMDEEAQACAFGTNTALKVALNYVTYIVVDEHTIDTSRLLVYGVLLLQHA
jgi:hypothetical protein